MEPLTERQEIWRGILYGQRSMTVRLMADLKKKYGLTVPQYEALLLLEGVPGRSLPASVLAKGLIYSSGSASHLIARMEELGWVTRSTGERDSRVVDVTLTQAGADLITEATRAHVQDLEREFSPLVHDEDVEVLLSFARRFAEYEGQSSQSSSAN